jgi:GcrA cell cycle regulator
MTESFWNSARDKLVTQLWAAGHSYDDIAKTLHVSKAAVAGRKYRLRLEPRQMAPRSQSHSSWTADRDRILRERWDAGDPHRAIAKRIGISHTGIVNRARKFGLPERPDSAGAKSRARRQSRKKPNSWAWKPPDPSKIKPPSLPECVEVVPEEQRCSILDLTSTKCRWPIGHPRSPGFCFCGAPIPVLKTYCTHHRARGGAYYG